MSKTKEIKRTYTAPYNETLVTDFTKMMKQNFEFAKIVNTQAIESDNKEEKLDEAQLKVYSNIKTKLSKYKPHEIKELFSYILLLDINKQLFRGEE
ncbi:MAG: hypothetical protein GY941_07110 [Planctomycetes bacterium]|nr:hypothetical protein [Planctomycetota bacterium]